MITVHGIDLSPYPAIRGWLERVRMTPGFVALREPDAQAASRIAQSD